MNNAIKNILFKLTCNYPNTINVFLKKKKKTYFNMKDIRYSNYTCTRVTKILIRLLISTALNNKSSI